MGTMTTLAIALRGGVRQRLGVAACAAAAGVALAFGERLAQDHRYHAFADARTLLGIPNALDVLSSAAFAIAGLAGTAVVLARRAAVERAGGRAPWLVLFLGVVAVAAASARYHLSPTNDALFWDRLAMSVGFAGFAAALVGDRAGPRAGARLLAPLVALSAASVVHWIATEHAGAGDLRAYVLVQAGTVAAVPIVLARWWRREGTLGWCAAMGLYLAAKVAEAADAAILRATRVLSGHTLKHLLAALAVAALAAMLARRAPGPREPATSPRPPR
jgi:hypothetical protein